MRRRYLFATIAAAAVALPALAADDPAGSKTCIANREIREKRMSAEAGYLVRTPAGWWRNDTSCPAFDQARSLITRSLNDRQCRGDVVEVFDPFSRINFGGCLLGDWNKVAAPPPKSARTR